MTVECLGPDRLEGEPQWRDARAGSLGAPAGQAVENEVDRSRRRRRDGGSSGRLGNLLDTGVGIDASGVHRRSQRLEICLARQRGIECFEPSRGIEQERWTIAAAREDERDLRAQSLQQRALKLVQRSELGRREQRLGGLTASRVQLGLRGGERARSASCRVRGQLGRSFQERGRSCHAASAPRAIGRPFQLIGHRLVETGCSVGAMPCAAIRIFVGIRRFRQGAMHLLTFMDRIPETWKPYFALAVGDAETDADFLVERSPRTYIDDLACPLLVIQGQNDPRVVERESSDLVERLRARGSDVDYLVFEDEGHDVLKLANRVRCYERIVGFFSEHLS